MTKLKTLKDITMPHFKDEINVLVNIIELKQEAIKWIKAIRDMSKIKFNYDGFCIICGENKSYSKEEGLACEHEKLVLFEDGDESDCWVNCIKHLFDISEEELK